MEPYTIRELDHYFKDMREAIEEIRTDGKETLKQAQRTNGRVNRHDWYFKAVWWALGAAWSLLLLGVPLLWRLLSAQIDVKIHNGIISALNEKANKVEYEK